MDVRRWFRRVAVVSLAALVTACTSTPPPDEKRDPVPQTAVSVTWAEALGQSTIDDPHAIDQMLTLLRSAERVPLAPETGPSDVRLSFAGADGAVSTYVIHEGELFDARGALLRGPSAERFVAAAETLVGGGRLMAGRTRGAAKVTLMAADVGIEFPLTAGQRAQLAGFFDTATSVDRGPMGGSVYPNMTIRLESPGAEEVHFHLNSPGYGSVPGRYFALPAELWPTVMSWLLLPAAAPDELVYLFQATHLQMVADLGEVGQPMRVDHTFDLGDVPRNAVLAHHFVRALREGGPGSLAGEESQEVGTMGFRVADELHEVKLLQDGFIYQGRSYRRPGLKGRLRAIMTAG